MTAAAIELLAGAATLLLLATGQHVDVHRARRKVLDHHTLVRAIVLVSTVDTACVPVRPVDVLPIQGHGKRVDGRAHNHLTVGARWRGPLDLLPEEVQRHFVTTYSPQALLKALEDPKEPYKLASAQYSLCSS